MKKLWTGFAVVFIVALTVLAVASSLDSQNQQDAGEASLGEDTIVLKTPAISRLEPHEHGSPGNHVTKATQFTAPRDMWITSYSVSVSNAPNATLHHGTLWRYNETEGKSDVLISWGRDNFNSISFRNPYGVFVEEGEELRFTGMFHNSLPPYGPGGTYENVSLRLKMGVEGSSSREKNLEHHLLKLVDSHGGMSTFTVPAGEGIYVREGESAVSRHNFSRSGKIVGMGAHFHGWEGGKNVSAYLNGDLLREFESRNISSNPWDWDTEKTKMDLTVEEGDVIEIRSAYERRDEPVEGAMGMAGFLFAPDE